MVRYLLLCDWRRCASNPSFPFFSLSCPANPKSHLFHCSPYRLPREDDGARISVGFQAPTGTFPSIVAIYLPGGLCAGTLISPGAVITAAHCVSPWNAQQMIKSTTLYIGLTDRTKLSGCNTKTCETRKIKQFFIHPGYNASNAVTTNDLAILILDTNSTINPASLTKTKPDVGKTRRLAGWGIMASSQLTAQQLMMTEVRVAASTECMFNDDIYYVSDVSICTKSVGSWANNYTATACEGDSGGPLMDTSKNELLGTVSYGILAKDTDPCGKYLRTVFMSMAYYKDWIYSIIGPPPPPPPPPPPLPPSPPSPPRRPPPPKRKPPPVPRRRPPPHRRIPPPKGRARPPPPRRVPVKR